MEDRISQLPEDIKHHILSFLPLEQQVRLSILSKTWKQAWTTFPVLEFGRDNYWGPDAGRVVWTGGWERDSWTCGWERDRKRRRRREQLTDFVEKTLRDRVSQSINLSKLVLVLPEELWNYPSLVSRWIEYSVKSNVKHLQVYVERGKPLYFGPTPTPTPKIIPVLLPKFMTVLDLSGYKLELRPPSNRKVSLCLKKLSLTCVSVDENSVQNLIHSCPDLEYLSISGCPELKSLKFIGLLKLKTLILDITEKLEIKGLTNLECFSFRGCSNQCPMMSISVCKNLTSLVLEDAPCFANYDWFGDFSCIFPLLNYLRLHHCHLSKSFKISGHCLVTVDISYCDKLTHLDIDAPNLLCFRYSGQNAITFFSNAMALSQADIYLGRDPKCMDDSWYLQVAEFLGKFNHCKIVNFDVIIPKKLRKTLVPPLYNVKHLTFKISYMFMSHVEYVESLLWISPRLETLSISQYMDSNISFKFTYEESMEKGDDPCCSTIPIICWRHSLKEVKIAVKMDNYRKRKYEEGDVNNYFHQNAKILQKIDVSDTTK